MSDARSQSLASDLTNGVVNIWDVTDCEKVRAELIGHKDGVRCVAMSKDGTLIASASIDATVKLWNIASGKCIHTFGKHGKAVNFVDFNADGTLLATGSSDKRCRIFDLTTFECIFKRRKNAAKCVKFNPNGKTLASVSNLEIKIWNIGNGELVYSLHGHEDKVKCIDYASEWKLVSGSSDKSIRIWSLKSYACIQVIDCAHSSFVSCVRVSSDGHTLASCSTDQTIRLWDLRDGCRLTKIFGISTLSFDMAEFEGATGLSDDNQLLLFGSLHKSSRRTTIASPRLKLRYH